MNTRLSLLAKLAISSALLGYLLMTSDLRAVERRLRDGDMVLLAAAAAVWSLVLLLSTWRWRTLLAALGVSASMRRLSASYLVATFFNNFLPSNVGGDVVRVRDSAHLTGSTTRSLAVIAIDRILGLSALYALAAMAFALGGPAVRDLAGAGAILLLLGAAFGVLAWVFFRPGTAGGLMELVGLSRRPWAQARFEVVQAAVHTYRERMGVVWLAFGGSLTMQALLVCYYFTVARALQIPLPLSAAFLMVPICTLLQTVPVSFNGWGVRESVYILYFRQVGLGRDAALAFSLVGAGLLVLLSLSGAVVWTARRASPERDA